MFTDFLIIFYSVDGLSPAKMQEVRKIGATVIHTYRMGHSADQEELAWEQQYMDLARKCGLKVMFNLNGGKWIEEPNGLESLRAIVRHFKDHPALAFWYLYDEPDGNHSPEQVRPLYELLKQETPNVPVAICSAWTKHWTAYTPVLDITMLDIYPVYDELFPKSELQHVTTFTQGAIKQKKPVIPVFQAITWKCFAKLGQQEYRGHQVNKLRYPEAGEIRYWIYGCVAQGRIAGVSFWSYHHSVRMNSQWIHETLPPALSEIKEFARLAAPIDEPRRFRPGRDSNLYCALWKRKTGNWLVLVNAGPTERDLSCRLEDTLTEGTLIPWGNTRATSATLTNGTVKVHARPWEVFIWKVETSYARSDTNQKNGR